MTSLLWNFAYLPKATGIVKLESCSNLSKLEISSRVIHIAQMWFGPCRYNTKQLSNNSLFLCAKIYLNQNVSDLMRALEILMKPQTAYRQNLSSNF